MEDVMQSESERLAAYRQLRAEIRGSNKHLIVGIDIAKEKHYAFVGTANGTTLCKQLIFQNNIEGFDLLTSRVEVLRLKHQCEHMVFGVEPTANYHKPLAEHLIRQGLQLVQVSGNAVKLNRELVDNRWDKHDRKDAANVADLIAQGKCQCYDYPPESIRDLRELLSLKKRFKKEEQGLKTRIRNNLLALYFPEMDEYINTCQRDSLSVVSNCCDPVMIAGMEFDTFYNTVVCTRKSQKQEEHLYQIWQRAKKSVGCNAGVAAVYEGNVLTTQLLGISAAIEELDKVILTLCSGIEEYPYLLSIPGIGPDTASKILAYVSDPNRFDHAKQVLKLAGFDLSASRSGKPAAKATPVISKKGQADLRFALCQAALVASHSNSLFSTWFASKLKGREREKGIFAIVRVKLAAKMLVIAWTLMKKKEMFAYDQLNNS
jgi:transposase